MDKTCKFHELWLNTELIFCDYPKAYGKILLAFRRGNQFHANSRSAYKVTRGRPIHRFCRLIGTIIDLQNYRLSAKIHADSFVLLLLLERLRRVCYHYTVWERPLEAEITDSTCCLFWHVTLRCTERETSNAHLNAANRKSCRETERHSHSFPLNNIIAYSSQIIVNVHNDFTLGYKLCIVHFSAKGLSFCGSNTVWMLHIVSSNRSRSLFPLALFFKHRTSNSFMPHSSFLKQTYVRLVIK